jgi:hypothetical protein
MCPPFVFKLILIPRLKSMGVNNTSIYIDIVLGIIEFILLFIYFVKTEEYATFRCSYYYYLIAAPCFWLMKIFQIILFPRSTIDPTQLDFTESDNIELSINRRSQVLQLIQLPFVSLLIILPTLIELIFGIISTIVKYTVTKNVSANDLYIIHFTTALLSVTPLCLKEIKSISPIDKSFYSIGTLNDDQKNYIFFFIVLSALAGIAVNTLVLISGGLIGWNICNSFA